MGLTDDARSPIRTCRPTVRALFLGVATLTVLFSRPPAAAPKRERILSAQQLRRLARPDASEMRRWSLFQAVTHGDLISARGLLDQGAPINDQLTSEDLLNTDQPAGKRFGTPLFFAAGNADVEMVRLLLARGARTDTLSDDGQTCLHVLAGPPPDLSLTVPRLKETERTLRLLTRAGAALNARDRQGYTPLMVAAQGYRPELVKLLLEQGASPTARDRFGRTALHLLALGPADRSILPPHWSRAALDTAHLLVARGADPGARDDKARAPDYYAQTKGFRGLTATLRRLQQPR